MNKPYYETELGKLYHGDCLEIMPHLEPVDLVLTDPPYGLNIANNPFRQKHEKKDWDEFIPSATAIKEILRFGKNQVIWGGNYFNLPATQGFLIWDKNQPENFSSSMCEFAWMSKQQPAKIFKRHVVSYTKYHPTQKPEGLIIWCLSFFPEAKSVADPYLGSGTTAVACERLNRRWIGIEIEEKYCEIATKRIENERKQLKLF